jgi:hypothetical protein
MKKILLIVLFIGVVIIGLFVGQNHNDIASDTTGDDIKEMSSELSLQDGYITYDAGDFTFSYPEGYVITETDTGVRITGAPLPEIDEEACNQLEDEQFRGYCLNPPMSPDIHIDYYDSGGLELWQEEKSWLLQEASIVTILGEWEQYSFSMEFGGIRKYGLLDDDKLVIVSYSHDDTSGGYEFDAMKSEIYSLNHLEQKELSEEIIQTISLK